MQLRGAISIGFLKFSPVDSSLGSKHPSRAVIFSGRNFAQKTPKSITSHDVLEPLKQVLSASRDVIISGQI